MTDTVRDAKRAAQIDAIHGLADWLTCNPDMPIPTLDLHRHLGDRDGTEAENLAAVRDLAARLDSDVDEHLDDRTVLRFRVNEHVWYELFAWHKGGRDLTGELERLRAENAELRAAAKPPTQADVDAAKFAGGWTAAAAQAYEDDAEDNGMGYTRADTDADDPTPVSPARVPMHTGGVVDGGELVDETEPVHMGYVAGGTVCGLPVEGDARRQSLVWRDVTCQACTDAMQRRAEEQPNGTGPMCVYETGGGSLVRHRCGDPIEWDDSLGLWRHSAGIHSHNAAPPVIAEAPGDGHKYACCGKVGRISRHEPWCDVYRTPDQSASAS